MERINYGTYEIPQDSLVEIYMDSTIRIFPTKFKRGDIVKMSNGSFDQPYVFIGVNQNKYMLVDKKGCLNYISSNAGIWMVTFENATISCTKEQKEQLRQFINKVKNGENLQN